MERARVITEVAKNAVEVVALLAAGIWALFTFVIKDVPGREAHFDAETTLAWTPGPSPDECFADWSLVVRNVSTKTLDVRRVDVRVWSFEPPETSSRILADVDLRRLRPGGSKPYLFNRKYTSRLDPLIDRYAPNGVSSHTYEWVFNRKKSPRWLVFEIDLYDDLDAQHSLWFAYDWGELCQRDGGG